MHVGSLFAGHFFPCKHLLPGATYKMLSFKGLFVNLETTTAEPQ